MERALRCVNRDIVEVDAEAVAVGVTVGEKACLQHLVRRETDAWYDVGWRERDLLNLREDVLGVAVQFEVSDVDEREVGLRPDLRQIEWIKWQCLRLCVVHHLDEERPAGVLSALDALKEIALVGLAILPDQGFGLRVRQILDALLGP